MGLKDNFASPPTHLHATLLLGDQSKSLQTIIDSAADMSLMDDTLVSELRIPTQPLSITMNVRVLDGRYNGQVTHDATPVGEHS